MNLMNPTHASWQLGSQVPQNKGRTLRWIGARVLSLAGWRFEQQLPDLPRFVVIVAPHTSNWDFVVALLAKWALGIRVRFIGKDTLFRPPLGWFMRAIGGIPVVRTQRNDLVAQSIHEFRVRDQFVLVLAPEGTRKHVEHWKTGFWHIARAAQVPIACVALDYGRKVIRLGPTVSATGDDAKVAVEQIRQLFRDVKGKTPRR